MDDKQLAIILYRIERLERLMVERFFKHDHLLSELESEHYNANVRYANTGDLRLEEIEQQLNAQLPRDNE